MGTKPEQAENCDFWRKRIQTYLRIGKRGIPRRLDDGSRMSGDVPVRMCVQRRLACSAGNKTCRGKSQRPRNLDSRVAGDQNPEAYRQLLRKGEGEQAGRNESERISDLVRE